MESARRWDAAGNLDGGAAASHNGRNGHAAIAVSSRQERRLLAKYLKTEGKDVIKAKLGEITRQPSQPGKANKRKAKKKRT